MVGCSYHGATAGPWAHRRTFRAVAEVAWGDETARGGGHETGRCSHQHPFPDVADPSPTARVRNHEPPVDVQRGAPAGGGTTVAVEFDRPHRQPPRLAFGRTGGVRGRSFRTDDDGNVVGVALEVARAGGTVHLFVDGA